MMTADSFLLFFLIVTSLPAFAISYNYLFLIIASFKYDTNIKKIKKMSKPFKLPNVTIIISSFNERYVIERVIDAVISIEYPKSKLQIIVADDSTDMTYQIAIDKVREVLTKGYDIQLVHRDEREGFKSGALNNAQKYTEGEYILLIDSDSIPPKDLLIKSLAFMKEGYCFISYKSDHINRNYNWFTRTYALAVDIYDTVERIGRVCLNIPFCFHGGCTLISKDSLDSVGRWSPNILVDDMDLSCKFFSSGKKGFFMKDVKVSEEDPPLFEAWKRQTARTTEGAGQCIRKHFSRILHSKISFIWKIELILLIIWPLASIGWLIATFMAALGLTFGFQVAPSLFQNPFYITLITIPTIITLLVQLYVLRLYGQRILENLHACILLPYCQTSMAILNSINFFRGLFGFRYEFFRTPKYGLKGKEGDWKGKYKIRMDKLSYLELLIALISGILSIIAFINLSYFLGLNLFAFFVITLLSKYER